MAEASPYFRSLYLRREYAKLEQISKKLKGCFVIPETTTLDGSDIWRGLIFIRDKESPWYKGAFSFTIEFPPGYPFQCPVAIFDRPFAAHPKLDDGCKVRFDAAFSAVSAMHNSILARLLEVIRELFVAKDIKWNDSMIAAAKTDVKRCSVIEDESAPYKRLFGDEAVQSLIEMDNARQSGEDLDTVVARWMTKKHQGSHQ